MRRRVVELLATGFGSGRLPGWPGMWGSVVGLGIGWLGHSLPPPAQWALMGMSLPVCAWICTQAEQQVGRHDPPSVVLDEVWGMAAVLLLTPGSWTPARLVLAFAAFRLCDTLKPPPLKRLARLPAGWGIMMDDLGAAVYTSGTLLLLAVLR